MQPDSPHSFFLAVPLDLESLALHELTLKWPASYGPLPPTQLLPGGIELKAPSFAAAFLNRALKIPTRVLYRVASFRCRDFPRLFQKAQKLAWRDWILPGECTISSSARDSRLFDSRRLEQAMLDGLALYWKANPSKKEHLEQALTAPPARIMLRLEDDLCTLSLDTSGERLGLRGEKTEVGEAPLRENLAAALLLFLQQNLGALALDALLLDPMCGSGTFPIEAMAWGAPMQARDFAFQDMPVFKDVWDVPTVTAPALFDRAMGLDRDAKMVESARRNARDLECLFEMDDLFAEGAGAGAGGCVAVLNPPYGLRLSGDEMPGGALEYQTRVLKALMHRHAPRGLGILIPSEIPGENLARACKLKVLGHLSFKHGGLPVTFWALAPR